MSQWWVRIRGRMMGPLTAREVKERLGDGQIQPYHECSPDGHTWTPVSEVPDFAAKGRTGRRGMATPLPSTTAAEPDRRRRSRDEDEYDARPEKAGLGGYKLLLVGLAGVLVVGAAVTAAVLVLRGGKGDGPITLTNMKESDRTQLFEESICLVVPGHEVVTAQGEAKEGYLIPAEDDETKKAVLKGSTGSGFVISKSGHILTNRHVVEGWLRYDSNAKDEFMRLTKCRKAERKMWVFFRKERYDAELVFASPNYDFAVLKVARDTPHFFALCDTPEKEIPLLSGHALGFPGKDREQVDAKGRIKQMLVDLASKENNALFTRVEQALPDGAFDFSQDTATVTKRSESMEVEVAKKECQVLRFRGEISGGNSGGPLVAKDGTVIGINTWSREKEKGTNFALTLPQLRDEINRHAPGVVWRKHPE